MHQRRELARSECNDGADSRTKHGSGEDIGGPVDKEVEPREGHEGSQESGG